MYYTAGRVEDTGDALTADSVIPMSEFSALIIVMYWDLTAVYNKLYNSNELVLAVNSTSDCFLQTCFGSLN